MSIDTEAQSDRLSPRREVGLVAIALSIAAHLGIAIALAAAWVPEELLSSTKRREIVPTDVDVIEEPGSSEAIADVTEKDEDLAQGVRGARDPEAPPASPTLAPPAPAAPAARPPPPDAPAKPLETASATRPAPAAMSSAPAGNPAPSGTAGQAPPGEPDAGGGVKRAELPSVMARFTHDLALWGSGVSAWQAAPVGDAGPIVVTIAVGEDGKLDKLHDPFAGKANELSAVLVESVSRTKSALVTKMGSQNVLVKFKVSAVVSDGTPPEGETLKLSFDSYDPKTKKGGSTFVLGTGRRVTFLVEVLETRALTDAP